VSELLPHYAKLLNHLDSLHSSKQLIPQTVCTYLSAICGFLKSLQWALQWSSVDYAAMLSCMGAARTKYSRSTGDQMAGSGAASAVVNSGNRQAAAAAAAAAAPTKQLQAGAPSTLTVNDVSSAGQPLRVALRKWVQACSIEGDAGRVHVAELLPQYPSLLAHLD
jgi:hypothetical protein